MQAPSASPAVPSTPIPSNTPRAPGVVPIQPVNPPSSAAPAAPPSSGPARIVLTSPSAQPDGTLQAGGGPYTMPITISGAGQLSSISLSITFDPNVVKMPSVTQGSFMMQGGAQTTFVPRVDAAGGRIDLAISRPAAQTGAVSAGLLAAIAFMGGSAGSTDVAITGVATSTTGQTIPLDFTNVHLTVK